MSIDSTICRVWHGHPNDGGKSVGTAFAVTPSMFLTCAHVVDYLDSLFVNDGKPAYLGGQMFQAPVPALSAIRPTLEDIRSNESDFSILPIDATHSVAARHVASIRMHDQWVPDLTLAFAGFAGGDRDREKQILTSRTGRVSGNYPPSATVILAGHASQGMSGGPVFLDDDVVGILKARSPLEGEVDIVTSHQFAPFLRRLNIELLARSASLNEGIELPSEEASLGEFVSFIRSLSPGPAMPAPPYSIPDFAYLLSNAYRSSDEPYGILDRANSLRKSADPHKPPHALQIPFPGDYDKVRPSHWWSEVIRDARARGERMYGSLLCSIDRNLLQKFGLC